MKKELTFENVVQGLTDGLSYNPEQMQQIRKWLLEYQTANELTLRQLNELCWADSDWVFNQIFN